MEVNGTKVIIFLLLVPFAFFALNKLFTYEPFFFIDFSCRLHYCFGETILQEA